MSEASAPKPPRPARPSVPPGEYMCCSSCGRLLRIVWATRSIVCACGARLTPSHPPKKTGDLGKK